MVSYTTGLIAAILLIFAAQVNGYGYASPLGLEFPVYSQKDDGCNGSSNTDTDTGTMNKTFNSNMFRDGAFSFLAYNTSNPLSEIPNEGKLCPYSLTDAADLIDGVERAVKFYEHYFRLAGKDYATGLTILNGQLEEILANGNTSIKMTQLLQRFWMLSGEYETRIFEIASKYELIPDVIKGVGVIRNNSNVWKTGNGVKQWQSNDIISKHEKFPYIGDEQDYHHPYLHFHCLVSIVKNCEFPSHCQETQMSGVSSQYKLTHQILTMQFADQMSCEKRNGDNFKGWNKLRDEICAKIYQEAELVAYLNFPITARHLFAQQVTFCGFAGYPNFFRSDWLQKIISWQSKNSYGCVPDFYEGIPNRDKIVNVQTFKHGEEFYESCLTGMTSMTVAALALNLRHMVDNCSPEIFNDVI